MRPLVLARTIAVVATFAIASSARAQVSDTLHRWRIFGGLDQNVNIRDGLLSNYEFGGSGDFGIGSFPLPLRATLAFSNLGPFPLSGAQRFGNLSLDAIAHPIPRMFGIRPYLLGGLGVATRAPFTYVQSYYYASDSPLPLLGPTLRIGRQNWAFAEFGAGLEMGRLFVQWKTTTPVASEGFRRTPLSIGVHF